MHMHVYVVVVVCACSLARARLSPGPGHLKPAPRRLYSGLVAPPPCARTYAPCARASCTRKPRAGKRARTEACVVDLVEDSRWAWARSCEGGHDSLLPGEHKVWSSLVWSELYKHGRAALCPDCTLDGATHTFGNTEASALRSNFGVAARAGDHRWDPRTGTGGPSTRAPAPHKVAYHGRHPQQAQHGGPQPV
jgi:hypothetical protein